tara:strand:- start:95 stop:481 length:387 start_codon:yes stop_codon:yes gene_type:complete
MPAYSTSTFTELGSKYVLDRDCKGNSSSNNVTGASGVIYILEIDNEANSSTVYVKIRDAASATPSTNTANGNGTPHYSFIAPAFSKMCYTITAGAEFATGLSMWCTTSKLVGSTSSASNPVIIKLITT